jgi:hypothetical protein
VRRISERLTSTHSNAIASTSAAASSRGRRAVIAAAPSNPDRTDLDVRAYLFSDE